MEAIAMLVLLSLGVAVVTVIWLVVRSVIARDQIQELTRRVDDLQAELSKVKVSATASQSVAEKIAGFSPAPAAPFQASVIITPHTAAPVLPPRPSVAEPLLVKPIQAAPVLRSAQPEPPPASRAIPPQPATPKAPPIVPPMPEPVLARAQSSLPPPPVAPADKPVKEAIEMRIGKYWAVRVGMVVILVCFALGASLAYHKIVPTLGPAGKISLLYLASALLLGVGTWWQRHGVKESLKNYAQVIFAGGLAAVYFTTYAAHYVPPVSVITSPSLDGILLLLWASFIAWIADRRKSEVMALFAIGLAFFTSVITRVGEFTLYSNLILTIAAVVFLVRNRWAALSLASLVASYVGYAFWRFLHDDGWHWASSAEENLWLGAGFLAGYWVVFTAAAFLSQNDRLKGPARAAFVTLNNGAYFTLFLLTMLQEHTGGFWKFSLIYGSVLLALTVPAQKFLAAEPEVKNTYLPQGLVLVTLGFISKFAGLHLALVLGAESTVLYVLAAQRRGAVLKFFAYAAGALASGWCATTLTAFDTEDLWLGIGLGGLLVFNAAYAFRWESQAQIETKRLESSAFTLLAFISWAAAGWANSSGEHVLTALVLAIASVVYYQILAGHKLILPKFLAIASAGAAAIWCLTGLGQFNTAELGIAVAIGAFLLANVWRAHGAAAQDLRLLRPEPTAFTLLAFAPWLAATWQNTNGDYLPLVFTAEAVALTFSIYVLRVREITVLGQLFLLLAQFMWLFHFLTVRPPWWNPLLVIGVTIALSHWWQHQKVVLVTRNLFVGVTGVFALAAVGIALAWLQPLVSAPAWLVVASLLAVATTGYGLLTRAWPLAVAGQIFLGVSVWAFLRQLIESEPEWYFPLVPLVVLLAFSLATMSWFARHEETNAGLRQPLLQTALVYRWLALAMSLLWIWDYIPAHQRVWSCMLVGAILFGGALWRRSREVLIAAAVYVVASLAQLWIHEGLVMDIYLPNLLALLALLVLQQIARRRGVGLIPDEKFHGAVIFIAGLSLWRYLSCWTAPYTSGFYVTMTWAGFAVAAFVAGFGLHERFLRWFGLAVLTSTVGRVVLVDVWHQEQLVRVLTFLALGVALCLVGFIYNKFEEKIRQWL